MFVDEDEPLLPGANEAFDAFVCKVTCCCPRGASRNQFDLTGGVEVVLQLMWTYEEEFVNGVLALGPLMNLPYIFN